MRKNKLIISLFGFSSLFILIGIVVAALGLPIGSGDLIIRFDNYHNEVIWAGSFSLFFGVVAVAAAITALNLILVRHMYGRERFLSYVLSAGTFAITFLFLIAVVAIALIN